MNGGIRVEHTIHLLKYKSQFFSQIKCGGVVVQRRRTGHRQRSQYKWRPQQAATANRLLFYSSRQFLRHTKSSLARIDKRTARAAGNTRYRYNKIGPLDHKMADNCVSLARTNTLSSTITKLTKSWKTSNKSYSHNLLNRMTKCTHMTYFIYNLEWEAWLAPIYKQIQTTKSQLTQCTKY